MGNLQATQNGSDLWLSYWVSHTHEERIEGTLLSTASTAWRDPPAAADAMGGWQHHTPWMWMSMAGAQSAGRPGQPVLPVGATGAVWWRCGACRQCKQRRQQR